MLPLDAASTEIADAMKKLCLSADAGIYWSPTGEMTKA